MADFSVKISFGMMRKTMPFLMFRCAIYLGIAVAYVLATGTGAGIGYGIGGFWDDETQLSAAAYGAAGGFGLTAMVLYFLREYLLYIVKAGHIAVMVEALEGRALPQGQVAYARTIVTERFGQANILFGLDQLIKGCITAVTGLIEGLMWILPIPGVDKIMGLVRGYLKIAVGMLDEVMLAHVLRTRAENPYQAAREALVLYAQNARPMMTNAAWVTALVWSLSGLVFVVMLVPAGLVVWIVPGKASAAGVGFALLFAWAIKAAVIEPFAIACMLQAYFKRTQGQTPNPEWERKLASASDKFRNLGERALSLAGARGAAKRFGMTEKASETV